MQSYLLLYGRGAFLSQKTGMTRSAASTCQNLHVLIRDDSGLAKPGVILRNCSEPSSNQNATTITVMLSMDPAS